MVNISNDMRVYTVPEINALLKKMKETPVYNIVSELPSAIEADPTKVYWLVTGRSVKIQTGTKTVTNAVTNESHQEPVYTEYPEVLGFVFMNDNWYCTQNNVPMTVDEIRQVVEDVLNPSAEHEEPQEPEEPTGFEPMSASDIIEIYNSVEEP